MLQIRRYILSARFEMENQKNIEKKQKKHISEVLWIGALPKAQD
jgi:NADPH-dependent glutamate synthase beta subunit-like oxidoreductase